MLPIWAPQSVTMSLGLIDMEKSISGMCSRSLRFNQKRAYSVAQ